MKKWIFIFIAFVISAPPIFSKEQPKKKSKQVLIEYKDGTTCKALVSKGRFVNGPIAIQFPNGPLLKGEYDSGSGSLIYGEVFYPSSKATYVGTFSVRNDKLGFMPKKSKVEWEVNADIKGMAINNDGVNIIGRRVKDNPTQFFIKVIPAEPQIDSLVFSYANGTKSHLLVKVDVTMRTYKMSYYDYLTTDILYDLRSQEIIKVVYFSNGDLYHGKLNSFSPVEPLPGSQKGTYSYAKGGRFAGTFDKNFVPLSGSITYENGETKTTQQSDRIWHFLSIAQIENLLFKERVSLKDVSQINENERLRLEEEKRREERRIAAEKRQQELDERRKVQAAKAKEEAKRQGYINKYGTKWGNLVYDKELTIGMTKAMCADIVPKEWYDITKYWGMEIWTYNPTKVRLSAMANKEDALMIALLEQIGVMNVIDQMAPTLTFENDRLTGFSK